MNNKELLNVTKLFNKLAVSTTGEPETGTLDERRNRWVNDFAKQLDALLKLAGVDPNGVVRLNVKRLFTQEDAKSAGLFAPMNKLGGAIMALNRVYYSNGDRYGQNLDAPLKAVSDALQAAKTYISSMDMTKATKEGKMVLHTITSLLKYMSTFPTV